MGKEKQRNQDEQRQRTNRQCVKPKLPVIVLNINGVFTKIKRERFCEWIECNTQLYSVYK